MSKAYMPMYWGDYFANTPELTDAEHKAYLFLIGRYWEREGLPNDLGKLKRMTGAKNGQQTKALRSVLAQFFVLNEVSNSYTHRRLDFELSKMKKFQQLQQKKSAAGVAARKPRVNPARARSESRERDIIPQVNNISLSHVDCTNVNTAGLALASAPAGGPASPSPSPACQSIAEKKGPAEAEQPRIVTINGVSVPWNELPDRVDRRGGNGVDASPWTADPIGPKQRL